MSEKNLPPSDLRNQLDVPANFFEPKNEGKKLSEQEKQKVRDHVNGKLLEAEDREVFRLIAEDATWRTASVEVDVENLNKAARTLLMEVAAKLEKAFAKLHVASEICAKHPGVAQSSLTETRLLLHLISPDQHHFEPLEKGEPPSDEDRELVRRFVRHESSVEDQFDELIEKIGKWTSYRQVWYEAIKEKLSRIDATQSLDKHDGLATSYVDYVRELSNRTSELSESRSSDRISPKEIEDDDKRGKRSEQETPAIEQETWRETINDLVNTARGVVASWNDEAARERVSSVFELFRRSTREDRYSVFGDKNDLWRYMRELATREFAPTKQATDTGHDTGKQSTEAGQGTVEGSGEETVHDAAFDSVDFAVSFARVCNECLVLTTGWSDSSMKQIVFLKLENYSVEEIADHLCEDKELIELKVQATRKRWKSRPKAVPGEIHV